MSKKIANADFYRVVDHITIFKSEEWGKAAAIIESFGKRSIAMYMWQFRDETWKRKHKFQLRNLDEWSIVEKAVDQLAPKL